MPRAPLSGDVETGVVVIGGGLAGCAALLELAVRGEKAVLLEAGRLGGHTARDVGCVPGGPAVPYASALQRLGYDRAFAVWEVHRQEHELLKELLAQLGDDCDHRGDGAFVIAPDREIAAALADSEDLLRSDGFVSEFLDHYMLEARFDLRGFAGALWVGGAAEVDAAKLVHLVARRAERLGARICETSPVLDLDLGAGGVEAVTARGRVRASRAFLAAGAWAGKLVPELERLVHETPGRVWEARLARGATLPSPGVIAGGRRLWRVTDAGVRVASFDPPGAGDQLLLEALPIVSSRPPDDAVAGFTDDGLPLLGAMPGLPVAVALGLGTEGHGYTLLAARWGADLLCTGIDRVPAPLRLARAWPRSAEA